LGGVIGREPELAVLQRFLDSIPSGPSALLLSGDPGIGKTTVWKEGLADALPRNYRILSCGPIEAETRLSYTALGDLLEPILVGASVVARAPAPGARDRTPPVPELGCPGRPEVADALFVSVHTVEANLKRIYRKLGIRSRTELASRFPSPPSGS
jgi:hypothetical protein